MHTPTRQLTAEALTTDIKNEAFYPVFQPINNGNGTVGAEVLLRWHSGHDVEGSIRCLSNDGKIAWFTQKFLFAVSRELLSRGVGIEFLTINICPLHLLSFTFIRDISPIWRACNNLGITLWIELTENEKYPEGIDKKRMVSQLGVCRGMGIKIAIDDYGSGYNIGEALIRVVKPNIVKVDRSLMRNRSDNSTFWERLRFLARKYQIELLSEGIENHEDLRFAKSQGIAYFQGYHLGKPGSLNQLSKQDTAYCSSP